jgi:hypothetical protein
LIAYERNKPKFTNTAQKGGCTYELCELPGTGGLLNPILPESYKDEVLEAAVEAILAVAERNADYYAIYGESIKSRQSHIIYEAGNDEKEKRENTPPIIAELNETLKRDASEGTKDFTVEWIAEKAGTNKNILYGWVKSDSEFTTALERLKDVQKNDLFKTGTEEDTFVNAMMIALLLMETGDRHYKSENQ